MLKTHCKLESESDDFPFHHNTNLLQSVFIHISIKIISVQCDNGDVRILTGETKGQLEVCASKSWALVCYDEWSDVDSSVVCRQLGYASGE